MAAPAMQPNRNFLVPDPLPEGLLQLKRTPPQPSPDPSHQPRKEPLLLPGAGHTKHDTGSEEAGAEAEAAAMPAPAPVPTPGIQQGVVGAHASEGVGPASGCPGSSGGSGGSSSVQGPDDPWQHSWAPARVLEQCGDVIDVVTPRSERCCCFTKSYSQVLI